MQFQGVPCLPNLGTQGVTSGKALIAKWAAVCVWQAPKMADKGEGWIINIGDVEASDSAGRPPFPRLVLGRLPVLSK